MERADARDSAWTERAPDVTFVLRDATDAPALVAERLDGAEPSRAGPSAVRDADLFSRFPVRGEGDWPVALSAHGGWRWTRLGVPGPGDLFAVRGPRPTPEQLLRLQHLTAAEGGDGAVFALAVTDERGPQLEVSAALAERAVKPTPAARPGRVLRGFAWPPAAQPTSSPSAEPEPSLARPTATPSPVTPPGARRPVTPHTPEAWPAPGAEPSTVTPHTPEAWLAPVAEPSIVTPHTPEAWLAPGAEPSTVTPHTPEAWLAPGAEPSTDAEPVTAMTAFVAGRVVAEEGPEAGAVEVWLIEDVDTGNCPVCGVAAFLCPHPAALIARAAADEGRRSVGLSTTVGPGGHFTLPAPTRDGTFVLARRGDWVGYRPAERPEPIVLRPPTTLVLTVSERSSGQPVRDATVDVFQLATGHHVSGHVDTRGRVVLSVRSEFSLVAVQAPRREPAATLWYPHEPSRLALHLEPSRSATVLVTRGGRQVSARVSVRAYSGEDTFPGGHVDTFEVAGRTALPHVAGQRVQLSVSAGRTTRVASELRLVAPQVDLTLELGEGDDDFPASVSCPRRACRVTAER